jgi:hypothetical protein
MTDTPKPLIYHDSVDDFRRGLVATHQDMVDRAGFYTNARLAGENVPLKDAVSDAWQAACIAYNATYALAAVLGFAAKEFGDDVAHRLAAVADDLIVNGDDEPGHNADVTPEKETTS